ncbi:Nucleolar GTP-binding protein 1 [Hanseniaspora valbyensis]
MQLTWKDIPTVPNSNDMLDIVLNRTQRKTPTIVRPGFKIQRIRAFYLRKVKFTSEGFIEKIDDIILKFPKIDDLHPFHKDLMDTLYEKNHYKISLASVSKAKTLIEQVERDYCRLLKFGQSLFQCKQLKRAALGRMATIVKKLKDPLVYLEQVRQHLGRLPMIDPNTRTLVICGYPNVGKSSFLRKITKADVEVQPYAFTTKSLFVGHFDYKHLRFQAIDTPGILDRPTEEMNNIEMQSIYAIAHLRSCILYFMDLSEQCGFSIEAQVKLFHNIKPLFQNKSVLVVLNKSDIIKMEHLDQANIDLINSVKQMDGVEMIETSCINDEDLLAGVEMVRNKACDKLLSSRMESKLKSDSRINNIMNKIHVSFPQKRDNVDRQAYIPESFKNLEKFDPEDPNRRKLAREIEEENGGAGVFNVNLKDKYLLENDEWKNDKIPEIIDGKNIADYIDPEIMEKLRLLEEEEEKLMGEGFYDSDDEDYSAEGFEQMTADDIEDVKAKAKWIREKQAMMINDGRLRKSLHNKAVLPRNKIIKSYQEMESHMESIGVDTTKMNEAALKNAYDNQYQETGADVIVAENSSLSAIKRNVGKGGKLTQSNRELDGVDDGEARARAERLQKVQRRERNRMARAGESDRHNTVALPKHLASGKRGNGKTDFR